MPENKAIADRRKIFERVLTAALRLAPEDPLAIDLGCASCIFLRIARRYGVAVTGVDARPDRVPPELIADGTVRIDDFRRMDLWSYDLVLALGVFYHLTVEEQLALVEQLKGKVVIVDTHYAPDNSPRLVDKGGYKGVEYVETPTDLRAAVGTPKSFWPTERELTRILGRRHDVLKYLPEHYPGRSFYLLVPTEGRYADD